MQPRMLEPKKHKPNSILGEAKLLLEDVWDDNVDITWRAMASCIEKVVMGISISKDGGSCLQESWWTVEAWF